MATMRADDCSLRKLIDHDDPITVTICQKNAI